MYGTPGFNDLMNLRLRLRPQNLNALCCQYATVLQESCVQFKTLRFGFYFACHDLEPTFEVLQATAAC